MSQTQATQTQATAQLLDCLFQGQTISRAQSAQLFDTIIQGEMSDIHLAAMLIALKVRGETIDEIAGAADALRLAAKAFPLSPASAKQGVLDIVGTGGDGHNTINISTTAAFVAAAAGAKVAKHGNRSVSSQSGSSDLLAHCGIGLTMSPLASSQCLDELGLCFLFAPHYHGGVKHAASVRQCLKTRTIFNVLGPLINPARPDFMLLGVYSPALIGPIAQVLKALGVQRAMVVHGDGLDEVALHGTTQVAELNQGEIRHYELTPEELGVEKAPLSALIGGQAADNALITKAILQGQGDRAHTNAVAINAGCALYLASICDTPKAGTALALSTLASGKAYTLLTALANKNQQDPQEA